MKTKLLLLAVLALPAASAKAQKPDSARAAVHYKFSHIRDTTDRQKPYTENMILMVGNAASVYKSYDSRLQMQQIKKQVAEQMAAGGPVKITRGPFMGVEGGRSFNLLEKNSNVVTDCMLTMLSGNSLISFLLSCK